MLNDVAIFYLRRTALMKSARGRDLFGERDRKSHLCVYNVDDRKRNRARRREHYQITFDG